MSIEIIDPNQPAPKKEFVHLHLHTTYSLLDGAQKIGDVKKPHKEYGIMNRLQELGMSAVAMTDHGNMFGTVDFHKKAKAAGIKPIFGCEVYICRDRFYKKAAKPGEKNSYHLLLLAQNAEGYKNLCRLVTRGYFEGFYYRPRIDWELLRKYSKGLIATSTCLASEVNQLLLQNRFEDAVEKAREYAQLFEGRFYIELQDNGIKEQYDVNPLLYKIAQELNLPMVATNDVHYLRREDAETQDVLMCISTRKTGHDQNRLKHESDEFFLKSPEEMHEAFKDYPGACDNTVKIAKEIDFELSLGNYCFPTILDAPENISNEDYMEQLSWEGLEERLKVVMREVPEEEREKLREEYNERMRYELGIIRQMGFCDYFVIVADFINWAKDNDIPVGPGRGSAAGSLVAFSMRITDIDPIRHVLLFERFLNPERVSMPDIDVDFCESRREEVIEYVKKKYAVPDGEAVAQIITFGKLKAKAAVRDVGRALGMPFAEVDKVAKLIPNVLNITLSSAIDQEPRLAKLMKEQPQVGKLMDLAQRLENLNRHASIHAAGLVISDGRPLDEHLPLYRGSNGEVVTQFDMKGVEEIGLIKFDFLGLKNLTLIKNCLRLIGISHGQEVVPDIDTIELEDPDTYKLLQRGDTLGVFQLESSGMRQLMMRLKPSRFDDVVALVALYRPGPLQSGMADSFIRRKHGEEEIVYDFPQLEPIMNSTYGVCIYQEQVMQVANILANYSLGEADLLRRAMGKKIAEEMEKQRVRFMEGAKENDLDMTKAGEMFDILEKFAAYGFNRSHSAAYGLIAYQTAWLKTHFRPEYMAALLTADRNNSDKVLLYINDCQNYNIEILPPDVNYSLNGFSVTDTKVCFGLGGIKGVGDGAIEAIVEAREKGKEEGGDGTFKDIYDFCERVDLKRVNKRVIETLINGGAFDSTGHTRSSMASIFEEAAAHGQRYQKEKNSAQISLFGAEEVLAPKMEVPNLPEWAEKERLAKEKKALGLYLSGHPLERYKSDIKRLTSASIGTLKEKPDRSEVAVAGIVTARKDMTTKKGARMAFITIEDLTGEMEVGLFPKLFQQAVDFLDNDEPLLIHGRVEKDENKVSLRIQKVTSLVKARAEKAKEFHIELSTTSLTGRIEEVLSVFEQHQGPCPVTLHLNIPERCDVSIRLPEEYQVNPTEALVDEIESMFGFNPTWFR